MRSQQQVADEVKCWSKESQTLSQQQSCNNPHRFPKSCFLGISVWGALHSEVLCRTRCWEFRDSCLHVLQKMDSWVSSVLRWHLNPKSLGVPLEIFCRPWAGRLPGLLPWEGRLCFLTETQSAVWCSDHPPALQRYAGSGSHPKQLLLPA